MGSIGGIAKALLMTQSTRPKASTLFATRLARESSSVTSVTTETTSAPSARTSAATSSRRAAVRLAITSEAPIFAASTASERPSPGPIPETTTTVPASSGTGV